MNKENESKIKPLQNCGKCGLCLATCPVYKVLKEEQASPRARLQLIKAFKSKNLKSSKLLKELVSKCLMCGSCKVTCPSGINHYDKFMEMRAKMVDEFGESPAIRSLIYLLSREKRLKIGMSLGKAGQKLTPDFIAKNYKLGNIPVKRFPKLNKKSLRKSLPEISPAKGEKKGEVVYFTGCATNYIFDDTGFATVSILNKIGYNVIIPRNQSCCGLPAMFHGAKDKAEGNIRVNIEAINKYSFDAVIVDCTTCGAALKDEYPKFLKDLLEKEENNKAKKYEVEKLYIDAVNISDKTFDILSFISKEEMNYIDPADKKRAVYHAPCHSRNSFNTLETVRGFLKKLPSIEYIPTMTEADCCGGGGTFFYEQPEIAEAMVGKKNEEIRSKDVDLLITDCPVCRINLNGNLKEEDNIEVVHLITLINEAIN